MSRLKSLTLSIFLASTALITASCAETSSSLGAYQCQQFDTSALSADVAYLWEVKQQEFYDRGECPELVDFYKFRSKAEWGYGEGQITPTPTTAPPTAIPPNYSDRNTAPASPSYWARPETTVSVPEPQERIYRNSRDFQFLENEGLLTPGGKYYNLDGEGSCSWGWTVYNKQQPERIFNLSAGHCGKVGEKVAVQASGEDAIVVGEFVDSWYDPTLVSEDYSLIEIYPEYHQYVGGTPKVTNTETGRVKLAGWQGRDWLEANRPYICRLGWRSGLACGSFRKMQGDMTMRFSSIQDNGDSGGPIWAYDPDNEGRIYAVGVLSFDTDEDATNSGGKILEPYMSKWNLALMQ